MKAKEASEARGVAITAAQWRTLAEAEMLFEKRVALQGNFEERYFAVMKLGEICDRFRRNTEGGIDKAVAWYAMAIALDSGRADALFYQGQLLRLVRRYAEAYAPLPCRGEARAARSGALQLEESVRVLRAPRARPASGRAARERAAARRRGRRRPRRHAQLGARRAGLRRVPV